MNLRSLCFLALGLSSALVYGDQDQRPLARAGETLALFGYPPLKVFRNNSPLGYWSIAVEYRGKNDADGALEARDLFREILVDLEPMNPPLVSMNRRLTDDGESVPHVFWKDPEGRWLYAGGRFADFINHQLKRKSLPAVEEARFLLLQGHGQAWSSELPKAQRTFNKAWGRLPADAPLTLRSDIIRAYAALSLLLRSERDIKTWLPRYANVILEQKPEGTEYAIVHIQPLFTVPQLRGRTCTFRTDLDQYGRTENIRLVSASRDWMVLSCQLLAQLNWVILPRVTRTGLTPVSSMIVSYQFP